MLEQMQQWLQSYMDCYDSGQVNLQVCDGKPGNCTVTPLDTVVLEQSRSLEGNYLVRYASRFRILYLTTNVKNCWIYDLTQWCMLNQPPWSVKVEQTGCKRCDDGTVEFTGIITAEYEVAFRREDI